MIEEALQNSKYLQKRMLSKPHTIVMDDFIYVEILQMQAR